MFTILFLQNPNFQLRPLVSEGQGQQSSTAAIVVFVSLAVAITAIILAKKLRARFSRKSEPPKFSRDNFFHFAARSGLSNDVARYLYDHFKLQKHGNPMIIFFSAGNMLQVLKNIYQKEKINKKADPVKFEENLSRLVNVITTLENYFHSVSSVLNTYLIPDRTQVFISDMKNSFRIQMTVHHSTPRTMVLTYNYTPENDDTPLREAGRVLTLWLLDNSGKGYAAYKVKLKRIRSYQKSRVKEYSFSHSWRQEVANIARKHRRIKFGQQGQIKLLSSPDKKPVSQRKIGALIMDISLSGCRIVINPKYRQAFAINQKLLIQCKNPVASRRRRSTSRRTAAMQQTLKPEPGYQMEGRIIGIMNGMEDSDDLCYIRIKFSKLETQTRNSLGTIIYGLEIVRLSR